jgi:hypothetical protein
MRPYTSRTPRWRGVTLVQELRAAGIKVAVAGDNCRDPFYAYGDHDMIETLRDSVKILHIDHPLSNAPAMAGPVPAERLHKYMLEIERVDDISDEMRAVAESEWPELAHKLPPKERH